MSSSRRKQSPELRSDSIGRESFKCTAPCLYLPGFSKRRTMVRLSSEKNDAEQEKSGSTEQMAEKMCKEPPSERQSGIKESTMTEASRGFSVERFTRSSCNSGIIFNLTPDDEGCKSPFFDLPVELIKGRSSDTKAPVNAAFVFSCDPESTGTRRALLIAQSKSLQIKSRSPHVVDHHDFARPSFSCPSSPTRAHGLR